MVGDGSIGKEANQLLVTWEEFGNDKFGVIE